MLRSDRLNLLPRGSILAFCETEEVKNVLLEVFSDPVMSRVEAAAAIVGTPDDKKLLKRLQNDGVPMCLIVEVSGSSAPEILQRLAEFAPYCGPETVVIVVGHHNDVHLYRSLISEGVADYLVAPMAVGQILRTLSLRLSPRSESQAGDIIAVVGARGGSGATTVAVNIAWQLANKRNHRTCLVDLDLPFGGVAAALDCKPDPEISSLLYTPSLITDVDVLNSMLIEKTPNLSVLCAAPDLSVSRNARNEEGMEHLIGLLRSEFAYTVLDLPLHWTPAIEDLLVQAKYLVLVTTPTFSGIPPTQTLLGHLAKIRAESPLVVLNHTHPNNKADWSDEEVSRALATSNIVTINTDKAFPESVAHGKPLSQFAPSHEASKKLDRLIAQLLGEQSEKRTSRIKSLFSFLDRGK